MSTFAQRLLRAVATVASIGLMLAAAPRAGAQDLEPRAYAANPVGAAFLLVGWARSSGSVITDPTLPVDDIEATIDGFPVGVGYTFSVAGKVAQAVVGTPYTLGHVSGNVQEQAVKVERSGLADTRARFAINLVGNDATGAREFARAPRRTILGVSLTTSIPTGQYYRDKLINLGTNRWAFRPEIGISVPQGGWDLDAYAGVWLFSANDDFFPGGRRRKQAALTAVQGHAAYTFRPRLWVAVDGTWYAGGTATVDDSAPGPDVNNARLGVTVSLPAGRLQSIKVAYSTGATVRSGTDFNTFSIAYSRVWLTKM